MNAEGAIISLLCWFRVCVCVCFGWRDECVVPQYTLLLDVDDD